VPQSRADLESTFRRLHRPRTPNASRGLTGAARTCPRRPRRERRSLQEIGSEPCRLLRGRGLVDEAVARSFHRDGALRWGAPIASRRRFRRRAGIPVPVATSRVTPFEPTPSPRSCPRPPETDKLRWLLAKSVRVFGDRRLGQLHPPEIAAWRMTIPTGYRFEATQALRQVLNRAVEPPHTVDVNQGKEAVKRVAGEGSQGRRAPRPHKAGRPLV
jgi:hypothetical protein